MKKAAVMIDKWKLPIFSRLLVASKFKYSQHPGVTEDTYLLSVEFEEAQTAKLSDLIFTANEEAKKTGKPRK